MKTKKMEKAAAKAAKSLKKDPALTAAVVAIGGLASTVLASPKLRASLEEFLESALSRAAKVLGSGEGDALGSEEEAEEGGEEALSLSAAEGSASAQPPSMEEQSLTELTDEELEAATAPTPPPASGAPHHADHAHHH